jgi:DNA-binding NtrC family response regulator
MLRELFGLQWHVPPQRARQIKPSGAAMSDQKFNVEEIGRGPGANGQAEAVTATVPTNSWDHLVDGVNYSLRSQRVQAEIYAINRALDRAGWNRKRAAQLLRISYRALLYKISRHKITRAKPASADPGDGSGLLRTTE